MKPLIFLFLFLGFLFSCSQGFKSAGSLSESGVTESSSSDVFCPGTTRDIESKANTLNVKQTCVATLPFSKALGQEVPATSVTLGGIFSVVCEPSGKWAASPKLASCPAPGEPPVGAVTWTTSPMLNPAFTYNLNRNLTFSVQPAGSPYQCFSRAFGSVLEVAVTCASGSLVAA